MATATVGDVHRWVQEAAPALGGAHVHRIWRGGSVWVLLARHHAGGDPDARAFRRVALEVDLAADFARCVALPAEDVAADDKRAKKAQARDPHPFLGLLRKRLIGGRIEDVTAVEGERIVFVDVAAAADDADDGGPERLRLAIELLGRSPNLILCAREEGEAEGPEAARCVGSLNAGRAHRPFEAGAPYRLPPPRPSGASAEPALHPEVEPDPEGLALGRAVAATLRAEAEEAEQASRKGRLARAARKAAKRSQGVLRKLEGELEEAARADEYEREGDLLKANLAAIPKGARTVTVPDYTAGPAPVEVELSLDPEKTPEEQAKALYKRARKLRSGEASIQTRLGETDAKLSDLEALQARLEDTPPDDEDALDRIEQELRDLGALPKAQKPKRRAQVDQGPRCFRTKEGHEILVGRSDEENDRLTMRVARGNDLFFHVRGCPGSHVILRVDPKRPPNHESLRDAGAVAVHYSKARDRGPVDVSYTPRKWVKKPRHAKPGLVQISNEKTVRAGGDPARIERVLATLRRDDEEV